MTTRVKTFENDSYTDYDVMDGSTKIGTERTIKPTPEMTNRQAIEDAATQALATNRTFIAAAKPGTAAAVADAAYTQAKALSRQMNGVIRLLLGQLDGSD